MRTCAEGKYNLLNRAYNREQVYFSFKINQEICSGVSPGHCPKVVVSVQFAFWKGTYEVQYIFYNVLWAALETNKLQQKFPHPFPTAS